MGFLADNTQGPSGSLDLGLPYRKSGGCIVGISGMVTKILVLSNEGHFERLREPFTDLKPLISVGAQAIEY